MAVALEVLAASMVLLCVENEQGDNNVVEVRAALFRSEQVVKMPQNLASAPGPRALLPSWMPQHAEHSMQQWAERMTC